MHGLRKAAARRLAEAGCTDRQIMSITGHKIAQEVGRYTRSAEQMKLAEQAMGLLKVSNPTNSVRRIGGKSMKNKRNSRIMVGPEELIQFSFTQ